MSEVVIKVNNLSKQYRLGQIGTGSLAHDVNRWWHRVRGKEDPYLKIGEENDRTSAGGSQYVWALKDLNFEVNHGEVLGIIGRNGAGKSTLLKILSRTTAPTTGNVKIKGRIASLLEVGTGFHPELSGRENIFLNGAILGMKKREIQQKFDEIVDFSGVERYIDTPVKRYSSGMYVRLAFAVAAYLESEILIVDEVLAVGDAEFQKKCLGKMKDVSNKDGRTVLFVSHNMGAVSQLCNKGLLMKFGSVLNYGNVETIIHDYIKMNSSNASRFEKTDDEEKPIQVLGAAMVDDNDIECNAFGHDERISLRFTLKNISKERGVVCSIGLLDLHERIIFAEQISIDEIGYQSYKVSLPKGLFRPKNYRVSIALHIPFVRIIEIEDQLTFDIVDKGTQFSMYGNADNGIIFPALEWQTISH